MSEYQKTILETAVKQLDMINLKFMNTDFQHVIQAKCAIEQVLREWPAPTEYKLSDCREDVFAKLKARYTMLLTAVIQLQRSAEECETDDGLGRWALMEDWHELDEIVDSVEGDL